MTLKKKSLSRDYSTFPSTSQPAQDSSKSPSDTSRRSVGLEAQRLASRNLWGESRSNTGPATDPNMGVPEEPYRAEEDASDPPPIYTPSETTADHLSTPPSPVLPRSQPEHYSVGESHPPAGSVAYPPIDEEGQEENATAESYTSSPLLERAQSPPDDRPQRCARWQNEAHKYRRRRFRKACWFSCALALCLWMMLPALFSDKVIAARIMNGCRLLTLLIRPVRAGHTGISQTMALTILPSRHGLSLDESTVNTRPRLRSPAPSSCMIFSISKHNRAVSMSRSFRSPARSPPS